MTAYRYIAGIVVLCWTTAGFAAQVPPINRPSAPRPGAEVPTSTAGSGQLTITLVGCVYGAGPALARSAGTRASVTDYILADATVAARPDDPPTAGVAPGTAPATGSVYDIENLPAERLKALAGKRVEIRGRIDAEDAPSAADHRELEDLPELEALSIREIPGTCPSAPALRR